MTSGGKCPAEPSTVSVIYSRTGNVGCQNGQGNGHSTSHAWHIDSQAGKISGQSASRSGHTGSQAVRGSGQSASRSGQIGSKDSGGSGQSASRSGHTGSKDSGGSDQSASRSEHTGSKASGDSGQSASRSRHTDSKASGVSGQSASRSVYTDSQAVRGSSQSTSRSGHTGCKASGVSGQSATRPGHTESQAVRGSGQSASRSGHTGSKASGVSGQSASRLGHTDSQAGRSSDRRTSSVDHKNSNACKRSGQNTHVASNAGFSANNDNDQTYSALFHILQKHEHIFSSMTACDVDDTLDGLNLLDEKTDEQFSRTVSTAMDCMGYNKTCIDEREAFWNKFTQPMCTDEYTGVVVGSKGEGLSLYFSGDMDIMTIISSSVCVDKRSHSIPIDINRNGTRVIEMDTDLTPPGYAYLYVKDVKDRSESKSELLDTTVLHEPDFEESGPSIRYTFCDRKILNFKNGPADTLEMGWFSMDRVKAWKCICPRITECWRNRERLNGWPSTELVAEVEKLDGHVVPVGCKGEENARFQWRICYTFAEQRLMKSLPLPVKKVYVILKEIKKFDLTTFKEITSYVLKNVVLWATELTPDCFFREENIIKLVMTSLSMLRNSIISGRLPSYMIPERNLFAGAKCCGLQKELCYIALTKLLEKGGMVLRDCPPIWKEMQSVLRGDDCDAKHRQHYSQHSLFQNCIEFGQCLRHKPEDAENGFSRLMEQFSKTQSFAPLRTSLFNMHAPEGLPTMSSENTIDPDNAIADMLNMLKICSDASMQPDHSDSKGIHGSHECNDASRQVRSTDLNRTSNAVKTTTPYMDFLTDMFRIDGVREAVNDPEFTSLIYDLVGEINLLVSNQQLGDVTESKSTFSDSSQQTKQVKMKYEEKCSREPSSVSVLYSRTGDARRQAVSHPRSTDSQDDISGSWPGRSDPLGCQAGRSSDRRTGRPCQVDSEYGRSSSRKAARDLYTEREAHKIRKRRIGCADNTNGQDGRNGERRVSSSAMSVIYSRTGDIGNQADNSYHRKKSDTQPFNNNNIARESKTQLFGHKSTYDNEKSRRRLLRMDDNDSSACDWRTDRTRNASRRADPSITPTQSELGKARITEAADHIDSKTDCSSGRRAGRTRQTSYWVDASGTAANSATSEVHTTDLTEGVMSRVDKMIPVVRGGVGNAPTTGCDVNRSVKKQCMKEMVDFELD